MRTCVGAQRERRHHVRELATRCTRTQREQEERKQSHYYHSTHYTTGNLDMWHVKVVFLALSTGKVKSNCGSQPNVHTYNKN